VPCVSEYSEYRVGGLPSIRPACDASGPYYEYPSGALCEYSEYPSGALSEYSEYRVGAYHPSAGPLPRRVLRGVLHEPCSGGSPHGCFGYSRGTQGTPRVLFFKGRPQAPEVHSPAMAFEVFWAVGTHAAGGGLRPSGVLRVLTQPVGGYGRQGYCGYSHGRGWTCDDDGLTPSGFLENSESQTVQ
jgi:hypothetical protein